MKKFAIVGCGRIAMRHAENIRRIGQLIAVCDVVKEKAEAMGSAYKAASYTSLDQMLSAEKELEMVAVCSPNGYHAQHIIKSLQAGKDVLTEKPLCLTKAAAWQIIETEKYCGKRLFVVKSARYNPIMQVLKETIQSGRLGKLYSFHLSCLWNRRDEYYTEWKGKLFPDGGTLYNQFSHYIDVLNWMFGEVKNVSGFKANKAHQSSVEFEDCGAVALEMESSVIGSFHWSVNAFQKNCEIALTIVAEKGTIKIGGENLNEIQYQQTEDDIIFPSYKKESWSNHRELYDHLRSVFDGKASGFPDAFDGLRAVETIEKIYKATS